ncbi:MAG: FkbM family methyltransferase [Helicobacteraceae bacterium]|jgi:FkbM family methyltransferase|nr:FkbM family methyltransferase [Helicobacteraceae bacterium]
MKNLHSYEEHDRLCEALKNGKAKVITYGMVASNYSAYVSDLLNGDNVLANFDSDPSKWNTSLALSGGGGGGVTIPTLALERLEDEYKKADALIVMTGALAAVGSYLDNKNMRYYFGEIIRDRLSDNVQALVAAEKSHIANHKGEIDRVKSLLSDRKSIEIYETLLKARTSLSSRERFSAAQSVYESDQYFPKDIEAFYPTENEAIVDGGAFNGDSALEFVKWTNGKFKHIYCFEPTAKHSGALRTNLGAYANVTCYQKGLSDDNKTLSFVTYAANPQTSHVSGIGNAYITPSIPKSQETVETIDVCAIDKTIDDHITFIKMDIEGSELSALKGGAKTIKKYKPKLAICIYHKIEDFWEIPLYIHSLVGEYEFYIRQHAPTILCNETVLYAVCDNSDK